MKAKKMIKMVLVIVLVIGIALSGVTAYKMVLFNKAVGLGEISITAMQKGVEKHNFIENEKLVLAHKLSGDETVTTLGGNTAGVVDNVRYHYYDDGAIDISL